MAVGALGCVVSGAEVGHRVGECRSERGTALRSRGLIRAFHGRRVGERPTPGFGVVLSVATG